MSTIRGEVHTWYLHNDEVVRLIDLQGSKWGKQYYVNLGVLIRQIRDIQYPRVNECHISQRLSLLFRDSTQVDRALDLEDQQLQPDERIEILTAAIVKKALPFLSKCGSVSQITQAATKLAATGVAVRGEVYTLKPGKGSDLKNG